MDIIQTKSMHMPSLVLGILGILIHLFTLRSAAI